MLARLDEIEGVAASRVDWTGQRFLLTLEADALSGRIAGEAASALGDGARLLDEGETREVLDSYRKGEVWMRAGETLRLSRFEAGVLAERYGTEAAQEMELDDEDAQRLVDLFELELNRGFERAHAGDGIEAVPGEFEAAARRILESSVEFLDAQQQTALKDYLMRFGGR